MARLHLALCELGVDSSAVTRKKAAGVPEKALRRFENWLTQDYINVFSPLRNTFATPVTKLSAQLPDILHLHWVSRWIDLPSLTSSLPTDTPIVVTPHDFGIFTGGCHLHADCEGFAHGCTRCPIVRAPFDNTIPLAARELAQKQNSFQGRRIAVVGNSQWTTSHAERSQVFPKDTHFDTIYPSLDPAAFFKIDRSKARARFNLQTDKPVIGFGCASLSDENKRLDLFLETAARVAARNPGLQILLFGDHHDLPPAPPGTSLHHAGALSTSTELSYAYSAMDVFCVTSRVETFGQVSVESQACGTPVAVFDAGGLSETLNPNVTGNISPNGDIQHLATSICALLDDSPRRIKMGNAGPDWVRKRFPVKSAALRYKKIYEDLCIP